MTLRHPKGPLCIYFCSRHVLTRDDSQIAGNILLISGPFTRKSKRVKLAPTLSTTIGGLLRRNQAIIISPANKSTLKVVRSFQSLCIQIQNKQSHSDSLERDISVICQRYLLCFLRLYNTVDPKPAHPSAGMMIPNKSKLQQLSQLLPDLFFRFFYTYSIKLRFFFSVSFSNKKKTKHTVNYKQTQ